MVGVDPRCHVRRALFAADDIAGPKVALLGGAALEKRKKGKERKKNGGDEQRRRLQSQTQARPRPGRTFPAADRSLRETVSVSRLPHPLSTRRGRCCSGKGRGEAAGCRRRGVALGRGGNRAPARGAVESREHIGHVRRRHGAAVVGETFPTWIGECPPPLFPLKAVVAAALRWASSVAAAETGNDEVAGRRMAIEVALWT